MWKGGGGGGEQGHEQGNRSERLLATGRRSMSWVVSFQPSGRRDGEGEVVGRDEDPFSRLMRRRGEVDSGRDPFGCWELRSTVVCV